MSARGRGRGGKRVAARKDPLNPFSDRTSLVQRSIVSSYSVAPIGYNPFDKGGPARRGRGKRKTNVNEDFKDSNPSSVTATKTKGKSNPNYARTESKLVRCNGVVSFSEVPEKVKATGVTVTTFNSVMRLNPSTGNMDPALLRNLLSVIEKKGRGRVVVACIAWMSNPQIIAALSRCKQVLMLVNKENYNQWGSGVCVPLYAQLPKCDPICQTFGHLDTHLQCVEVNKSIGKTSEYAPVRMWGNGVSLEHNKTLIFLKKRWVSVSDLTSEDPERMNAFPYLRFVSPNGLLEQLCKRLKKPSRALKDEDGDYFYFPNSYWSGSYNFTKLSSIHHEGAEYFQRCPTLAWSKFADFAATWMQSKPIGGNSNSLTPQNHIDRFNNNKNKVKQVIIDDV